MPWPHALALSKHKCLPTAGIYCTISPPLSDVMEDYFIVWVQQLQMTVSLMVLYVRVTTQFPLAVERSRRSRASAARRQSSARYDGEMPDSDR